MGDCIRVPEATMLATNWHTKPLPIWISTVWWGFWAILAPFVVGWISIHDSDLDRPETQLLLVLTTFCLSLAILGGLRAYWLGHPWARYFAILSAALGVWRDCRALFWTFFHYPTYRVVFLLALAELAFNLYLLGWFSRKESRDFFEAKHKIA